MVRQTFTSGSRVRRPIWSAPDQLHVPSDSDATSCGCTEGALGALAALGLYLGLAVGMELLPPLSPLATWALGLAATVAGGLVGKAVGIWRGSFASEQVPNG